MDRKKCIKTTLIAASHAKKVKKKKNRKNNNNNNRIKWITMFGGRSFGGQLN